MSSSPVTTLYLSPDTPALVPASAEPRVAETQVLACRQWAELRAQVQCEPLCVGPVLVASKPQVELVVQLAGQLRFGISRAGRQQRYRTAAGSVFLTGAQKPAYELEWLALSPEPVRTVHVFLAANLLARTAADSGLNPDQWEVHDGSCVPDPLLLQLGLTLAQELQRPADPHPLFVDSLAQLLAAQLVRSHSTRRPPAAVRPGRLTATQQRQVQEYVRAHLHGPITLAELANTVHLSPYHFCRTFARTTGLSPNQYVIRQRLAKAQQLLSTGRYSSTQVAYEVGYTNPSYFAQLFRRHLGYVPSSNQRR